MVLPPAQARAAAAAYLYCRMLDTYEDLWPDPSTRAIELRRFGARFDSATPAAPTPIPDALASCDRDRVHLLLVARCSHVDAVFATLPADVRARIGELVRAMSEGMVWSTDAFASQGGVLVDEGQLSRYCRNVIGNPALFMIGLVGEGAPTGQAREDALLASEMIQLANVTRDIEADLVRGIAYHPALEPHLGCSGYQDEPRAVVREVRRQYVALALRRASAYRRLFEGLRLGRSGPVRLAAVLMLLFTDLHYRGCAGLTGHPPWPGPRNRLGVVARSLPALASERWAAHTLRAVERRFITAARSLEGHPA